MSYNFGKEKKDSEKVADLQRQLDEARARIKELEGDQLDFLPGMVHRLPPFSRSEALTQIVDLVIDNYDEGMRAYVIDERDAAMIGLTRSAHVTLKPALKPGKVKFQLSAETKTATEALDKLKDAMATTASKASGQLKEDYDRRS